MALCNSLADIVSSGLLSEREIELWRHTKDPIERLRRALESAGRLDPARFDAMAAKAANVVEDAIRFADESPPPAPETATRDVTALPFDPRGPGQ